ncbi:hypothetical protein M2451_001844 [Dysgonomonas sp. PFB1-18]|uniref:hypothetical protein n=1 Tax=unclassified Dysgonomonas TaxID=2630389 RepID=UPI0024737098|nr:MULTISPECIES: hypothetical protein [unclassified Dysgonomonas]MDH6309273.1 hypothetical protein [Dysgonomonas sp. PF1-14]MDH6338847.1 hypothetical protein [Dysgonomonas sp. PF1-16]MDH6380522.1 hypothetical protein [Dysgonomonas sp. PFB1-18]MDH6397675.1 hypothetical protein [Dysgonomonas sp. PF1-23]
MKYLLLLIFGGSLFITGCHKPEKHPVDFYYWKTNISLGDTEKEYFKKLNSKRLYLRFFDVDINNDWIEPKAKIRAFDSNELDTEYVPVVFITNRTFLDISEYSIKSTARNVSELINRICETNNISDIHEIQIDCDWTESTRVAYFTFLSLLKEKTGKTISCTLRLHQVKYRETTGVPPVEKVVLMCYATSDPTDDSDKNSILDISLLKDYTKNINSYPVDFDVALPLYSWAIVTNHLGKIKLLNNVTQNDMDTTFFRQVNNNEFEAKDDFFFQGVYMNKGFIVKTEGISSELLNEAKQYLDEKINKDYNIIYYHLDKPLLERFTIDELK